MQLFDVLMTIASTLGPVVAGIVTWMLAIRRTVTRVADKVLEKGDLPAPLVRAYITREQVKDLLREREDAWRATISSDSAKQEEKASGRFQTIMESSKDSLTGSPEARLPISASSRRSTP